jgi:hypothetical protein
MAILTRKRYKDQGYLFHPRYTGVYSDNEFTDCAYADGVILEARDLVFRHDHPLFTGAKMDATTAAQNTPERYAEGKKIYDERAKFLTVKRALAQ